MNSTKLKRFEIGSLVLNLVENESTDDLIRAARLKKKAETGDKKADKELERMENTPMVPVVDK